MAEAIAFDTERLTESGFNEEKAVEYLGHEVKSVPATKQIPRLPDSIAPSHEISTGGRLPTERLPLTPRKGHRHAVIDPLKARSCARAGNEVVPNWYLAVVHRSRTPVNMTNKLQIFM